MKINNASGFGNQPLETADKLNPTANLGSENSASGTTAANAFPNGSTVNDFFSRKGINTQSFQLAAMESKSAVNTVALPNTPRINELRSLAQDPRVSAFLNLLSDTEGTRGTGKYDGYDKVVNGTVVQAPQYPDLVGKNNVLAPSFKFYPDILVNFGGGNADVAGRYQFQYFTYRDNARELGLPEAQLNRPYDGETTLPTFTPEAQDLVAIHILQKTGAIDALLKGDVRGAINLAAGQWASLPKSDGSGIGDSTGQGKVPIGETLRLYQGYLSDSTRNPGAPSARIGQAPDVNGGSLPVVGNAVPILGLGDNSAAVGDLQTKLNQAGANPPLIVDNDFGRATETALQNFQRDNGLTPDGLYGSDTRKALESKAVKTSPAAPSPTTGGGGDPLAAVRNGTKVLGLGSTGDDVKALQKLLNVQQTGTFGQTTAQKVLEFKQANGITPPDDPRVGATTLKLLEQSGSTADTSNISRILAGFNNNRVDTPLRAGEGYTSYSPQSNQYATARTIKAIQLLGQEWAKIHPEAKNNSGWQIAVGDISLSGGGEFPPHSSHQDGTAFDVAPIRRDRADLPTNVNDSSYDPAITRNLVQTIKRLYPNSTILFNDPALISEGLTQQYSGHDNHLHIQLR